MSIRYLTQPDKSGWLIVKFGEIRVSLPGYLKVELLRTKERRDYFRVLEGPYQNQEASVMLKPDGSSYLSAQGRHLATGKIKFNRTTEELWYGSTGPVKAFTSGAKPVPLGTHDLAIPDAPHPGGINYIARASYATVWFRIGTPSTDEFNDRYLHTGQYTAGCVTVKAVESWDAIYGYLIDRRKGDGRSVGTIIVVEQ